MIGVIPRSFDTRPALLQFFLITVFAPNASCSTLPFAFVVLIDKGKIKRQRAAPTHRQKTAP